MPRKPAQPLLQGDAPLRGGARQRRDRSQPRLTLDPMPSRIDPCLALLKQKPPAGPDWLYEIKWDGYRVAVHVEPDRVRVLTRGGHDWTTRFTSIAEEAKSFGTTMILDGEACVLDEHGRSDFGALQRALGGRGGRREADEAILFAFDLLYFDGHDISGDELSVRRHQLEDLLRDKTGAIRLSEEFEGDGAAMFRAACEHDLEGIIAKRRDRPYRSGRGGDWLKIKCIQSEGFFIVGYEPSEGAIGGVGRLLLAGYQGDRLKYVGGVGTGFKERPTIALRADLDKLKTKTSPVGLRRSNVVWVQPTLIAEVEFRAWTDDGKLRHASYKGLREVQDNAEVFRLDNEE